MAWFRDGKGRPVVAEVSIVEQTMAEQEHWQTRCRDGHTIDFARARGIYGAGDGTWGRAERSADQSRQERLRIDFTVEAAASSDSARRNHRDRLGQRWGTGAWFDRQMGQLGTQHR